MVDQDTRPRVAVAGTTEAGRARARGVSEMTKQKETWEMTREEYAEYYRAHREMERLSYLGRHQADLAQAKSLLERGDKDAPRRVAMFQGEVERYSTMKSITAAEIEAARIEDIGTAIEDGEAIPEHIQADYPQLFQRGVTP